MVMHLATEFYADCFVMVEMYAPIVLKMYVGGMTSLLHMLIYRCTLFYKIFSVGVRDVWEIGYVNSTFGLNMPYNDYVILASLYSVSKLHYSMVSSQES